MSQELITNTPKLTLPTNQEADEALADFLQVQDENKNELKLETESWRQICMRLLCYATQYDALGLTCTSIALSSDAHESRDDPGDSVLYVLNFLLGALTRYHSKIATETVSYSISFDSAYDAARISPESVLADALWLFGLMLEPLPVDSNTEGTVASAEAFKKLGKIVNGLVHGHPSFGKKFNLIPLNLFQKTLSTNLLSSSDVLGANGRNFMKKFRKLNTDMFYRQKKVNLMQEESEGYAKLLSFLISLPSLDSDFNIKSTGLANDKTTEIDNSGSSMILEQTVWRIKELIGVFDLDPNRVLDLTLDALEAQLQSIILAREERLKNGRNEGEEWDRLVRHAPDHVVAIRLLLEIFKMFPKKNITHLIGFKYSSYSCSSIDDKYESGADNKTDSKKEVTGLNPKQSPIQSDINGQTERTTIGLNAKPTPKSLYLTTAILCSHDLVSLPYLLPHLNATMPALLKKHEAWSKEYKAVIKKMGVVSLNSSNKEKGEGEGAEGNGGENSTDAIKEIEASCERNQLVQLLRTLIEVGIDWKNITRLFSQKSEASGPQGMMNPSQEDSAIIACCSMYPPLSQCLCRYVFKVVEDVYNARVKDIGMDLCHPTINHTPKQNDIGLFSLLPSKLIKGPESLCCSATLLDLSQVLARPLIVMVATGCISSSPVLYCKLCRLVRILLLDHTTTTEGTQNVDKSTILKESIFNLFQSFLIPSLSLFPSNPSINSELWSVLCLLPYQIRYVFYDFWRKPGLEKAALRGFQTVKKPLMQVQSEVTTAISTRYLLRRMSKDNIRDMGKQISKVSHNNPLVVFTLILNQIESYDNFISLIVDAFKFVGVLSLDVLGYCLLLSLGGGECGDSREKVKADGVSTAQWLSSLETFAGAFYKKFSDIELRGLLAYLTRRLKDGYILELGVMQSLLKVTGGYDFADSESAVALSEVQLEGRCGTQLLKRETSDFGVVKKFNVKSSSRLRSLLQENAIGVVYLILLSQSMSRVLFGNSEGHSSQKEIKLIGNLNDSCRKTIYILHTCLTDLYEVGQHGIINEEGKQMALSFPTLGELYKDYGVDTAAAWMLCRPLVHAAAYAAEDAALGKEDDEKNEAKSPDIPTYLKRFYSSSQEMRNDYLLMLPEESWKHITPLLFERFYSLSIYDLYCPEKRYEAEIVRLKKEVDKLLQLQRGGRDAMKMKSVLAANAAAAGGTQRQIREASTFSKSNEQELERTKQNSEILTSDLSRQKKHCKAVSIKLSSEKNLFFSGIDEKERQHKTASFFLTHCVYPRCVLSPDDALFCSHFVKQLHSMETPGFFTLQFFDCIVNAVIVSVYSSTENEAANLGILLKETWQLISSWRYEKEIYDKDCANKPGAMWSKLNNGVSEGSIGEESLNSLCHSEFICIYNRWHALLSSTFIGGLKSSEYMHTRTALILLTRIVNHFPTKSKVGDKFLAVLEPLESDSNPMQDIKLMAKAFKSQMSKIEWKEEDYMVTKARLEKERLKKKKVEEEEELKKNTQGSLVPFASMRDTNRNKADRRLVTAQVNPRPTNMERSGVPSVGGRMQVGSAESRDREHLRSTNNSRPGDTRHGHSERRRERDKLGGGGRGLDEKKNGRDSLGGRWESSRSSNNAAVDENRNQGKKRQRSPDARDLDHDDRKKRQPPTSPDPRRSGHDRRYKR